MIIILNRLQQSVISSATYIIDQSQTTAFNLDQVLDSESGNVSKHLGQIADFMKEWEGSVAEELMLTQAEINNIKEEYKNKLKLQK